MKQKKSILLWLFAISTVFAPKQEDSRDELRIDMFAKHQSRFAEDWVEKLGDLGKLFEEVTRTKLDRKFDGLIPGHIYNMIGRIAFNKHSFSPLIEMSDSFVDKVREFLESIKGTPIAPILGNIFTLYGFLNNHKLWMDRIGLEEIDSLMTHFPHGADRLFKVIYTIYKKKGRLIEELSKILDNEYFEENVRSIVRVIRTAPADVNPEWIKTCKELLKILSNMIELNWHLIAPVSKIKLGDREYELSFSTFKLISPKIFNREYTYSVGVYNGFLPRNITEILGVPENTRIAPKQGSFDFGDCATLELVAF